MSRPYLLVFNTVDNAALRRNVSGEPEPADSTISNAGKFTQQASAVVVELGVHL